MKKQIINNKRCIAYPIITLICFWTFINYTNIDDFDKKEILSTIISVISIIIAITVTYLFSKLFAEKTIKIERKKEIDKLSTKITYLRRIASYITRLDKFWKFNDVDIKATIDREYKDLTYKEYQSAIPGHRKFSHEESTKISEKINGTDGQAYLAIKGLVDGENSHSLPSEFNPKNYSLNDIRWYKEYVGSFLYLLDTSDDEIVNFKTCNRYWLEKIDELYYKILGKQIDKSNYKKELKDLLSKFNSDSGIFDKHYYLNSLNSGSLPKFYKNGLINMVAFLLLLIVSVFVFVLDFCKWTGFTLTVIILSVFIANTIDLILITYQSITSELKINEIYKI